jgi:hypothetical protein
MDTRRVRNVLLATLLCGLALGAPTEALARGCEYRGESWEGPCGESGDPWYGYGNCWECTGECREVICNSGMVVCC